MKIGNFQLPCVCFLTLFLTGSISLSAWVCPAGHHSFQTCDSLFLGSLCFLTPPFILRLTLYGSSFFSSEGKEVSCVHVSVFVCVCM